jgi:uncharacterized protein
LLEQLRHLVELQHLENKKTLLIRSRNDTPKRIAEVEREYQQAEAEYLIKKGELDHARKLHRSVEQSVGEQEAKIVRSRQRMSEVKNNKEYQAMNKEIEELKKDISSKEDQMLEIMERIESFSAQLKQEEKVLAELKQKMELDRGELLEQSEKVNEQLDRFEAAQQKVREKLEASLLKRCDSLFQRHSGIAVAAVESGVCQVCHMNIPPQKFIELQRDENIFNCPHCHRFIYWPGHADYQVLEEELEEV